MTYSKTWAFGYNTAPTDQATAAKQAASFVLQLKDFLVAGGWSVVQSCDSTQYGASDYLTDVATDFVWAASGVHTWLVMKSPEGIVAGLDGSYTGDQSRLWFSIDLNNASVYNAAFRFHNANPTTGASTSACPTSTNQIGYAAQQFLRSSFSSTAYFHFARTSEGAFFAMTGYSGMGYMPFFLGLLPCTNVPKNPSNNTDYPYGVTVFGGWYDGRKGALDDFFYTNDYISSPQGVYIGNWSNQETSSTGLWGNTAVGWRYTGVSGSVKTATAIAARMVYGSGSIETMRVFPQTAGGLIASTGDAWTGSQVTFPVQAICTNSGATALIGTLADIYASNQGCAQGAVDGTTVTQTAIGSYWLPANVAPIL